MQDFFYFDTKTR